MQNTFFRPAIVLASAALLSACAASYQVPTGGEVARIRLVSPQTTLGSNTHMLGYESGTCTAPMKMGMVGGIARLAGEKPLGIPSAEPLAEMSYVERQLPAGKRYLLTVRSMTQAGNCVVSASFIPAAGKDYQVAVTWDTATRTCSTALRRIEKDANGKVVYALEESAQREPQCKAGLN